MNQQDKTIKNRRQAPAVSCCAINQSISLLFYNKEIDSTGQKTAAGDFVLGSSAAVLCLKKKNMPVPE